LTRVELIDRLAALIPPPRADRPRYPRVLAPRSSGEPRSRPGPRRPRATRTRRSGRRSSSPPASRRPCGWGCDRSRRTARVRLAARTSRGCQPVRHEDGAEHGRKTSTVLSSSLDVPARAGFVARAPISGHACRIKISLSCLPMAVAPYLSTHAAHRRGSECDTPNSSQRLASCCRYAPWQASRRRELAVTLDVRRTW